MNGGSAESGVLRSTSKPSGVLLQVSGWALWGLGVVITLGAFWYIGWGGLHFGTPAWWEYYVIVFAMLAGAAVTHLGQQTRLTGRRHLTTIASFPGKNELYVLYLRSFSEDTGRSTLERTWLRPEALVPGPYLVSLFLSGRSLEEHLISGIRGLGPVLAVGSPRERLPPAGAQRLYLPRDDWQRPVRRLMSRARLVVIVLDAKPGTLWEFVEATRLVHPQRLLLVAPPTKEEYDEFRSRATVLLEERATEVHRRTGRRWCPPALPEYLSPGGSSVPVKKAAASGLIHYSAEWKPTFSPLYAMPLFDVLHLSVRSAARPALDQLIAFEKAMPATAAVVAAQKKARLLRMAGHVSCFFGFFQLLSVLLANDWRVEVTEIWRPGIPMYVFEFVLGLVILRLSWRARRRAAPGPSPRR